MPLDGWDHVELWVGNAKQAAYFYEHAMGSRAPRTRARRRACATAPRTCSSRATSASSSRAALREDSEITKSPRDARRRRQGHRAHRARRDRGVPPGGAARRARRRRAAPVEDEFGTVELVGDRDVRRHDPHVRQPRRLRGPVPARLRRASSTNGTAAPASASRTSTTSSATSSSAAWTTGSSSTSASSG